MSKNIGETGFGQWRSSKIQKSSRSPSSHSIGKLVAVEAAEDRLFAVGCH